MGANRTTVLVPPARGGRTVMTAPEPPDTRKEARRILTVHRSRTPRHAVARATALACVALASAMLLASTPAPATGWQQGAAEATLFQLMNGARVNNGRRAVQQHGTLVSLARWRSKDQVDRNYFDHTILGTGYQVYHWYDLNGLQYRWGGENIGWNNGYSDADSPVAIHQGFMDSPGPPRQHPGAELHARRRGRLRQGQRQVPWQAAQPALLHRALHGSCLGSATASTLGGRRRWWRARSRPHPAAVEAAATPPARRATSTAPSPTPGRCMSTRRLPRAPRRRWTAARWSPLRRGAPRAIRAGAGLRR